jgi:predicted RNA binding protein YcfA (HicA-like mRNA interferase family)
MSKLKLVPYGILAKVADAKRFHWVRRVGSHNTFRGKAGRIIVIPDDGSKVIVRPLLRKILRDMSVSLEEFEQILKEL